MAVSLIIPSLCSCKDDDEDSPLYINGINMEGIWAKGTDDDDFEEVDDLYKFTKDGVVVFYESNDHSYPLVNGIMQCAFSNFYKEGEGTWSVSGNTISVSQDWWTDDYTIIKVISPDEAELKGYNEFGIAYNLYVRRVKGFKK
jgi:hypothetical protein